MKREHTLYETGDLDAPAGILDRNGEVVLAYCRVCGKAEIELAESCPGPTSEVRQDAAPAPA